MSKKLLRLTEALYSQPHLISQSGFNTISQYLSNRNKFGLMNPSVNMLNDDDTPEDLDDFSVELGIGVVQVQGALTYKPVNSMCADVGCSYEDIIDQVEEMINAGVKTIVFNCDSPGGEGYGAFECADEIRKMCDEAGVYTIAYNDGCMASACYALACQCDEVVSNPAAETGSIGVLIALHNDSKMLEEMGIARSFISAGEQKIPFAADGSWKPEFIADLQNKVDTMYQSFREHVSKYTGLAVDNIRSTQAKCFLADDALALGLVNSVMTRSAFVEYILSNQNN